MPIFSEGIRRGAEERGRMQKALRRSRERREKCGRHSEVSEAKRKRKAVKRVEGGTPEERGSEGSGRG